MVDEELAKQYRAAYDAWITHLARVHAVLLDGEALDPMHKIALIRRESHLKERYEEARQRFFGLPSDEGGNDPFPS